MKLNITSVSRTILLVLVLCFAGSAISQTAPQDFSSIRVDELNDDQIREIIRSMEANGMGNEQLEQVAQARGMRAEEIQKLRTRADRIKEQDLAGGGQPQTSLSIQQSGERDSITRIDPREELAKALEGLKPRIFGSDLFSRSNITFQPNLRMATPVGYNIGPDDQIIINVYGNSVANWALAVTPEGTINIPGVGILSLSGKTIEQATSLIRARLVANNYAIGRGTSVAVGIGNIRSIKVILSGEVKKPGAYTLPSVSTVFNALYASGGPSENGSFRKIEVLRNNRVIVTLDIYDWLVKSVLTNDITLRDQDVIRVPVYANRVELAGEVKRPAIYEALPDENLSDVINFAGGFTNKAYTARVPALQNTATGRKLVDITPENFSSYKPKNGDKYIIGAILERFENRVTISGAIFRPGPYELTPGLTVGQLIRKAEGVREDAFQNQGKILRLKDDLQTEIVSFDVARVLAGQDADIALKREDEIILSSKFDLKEEFTFIVQGEVQRGGTFKFVEGMSLEDAIIQAGGLKDGASVQRVEISRRIKNSDPLSLSARTAEVFLLPVNRDLRSTAGYVLQPFDIIVIRPSTGYEVQKIVQIAGEVLYPGPYTIIKKNERISEILMRSGGVTAFAYTDGASLSRAGTTGEGSGGSEENRLKQLQRLQRASEDTTIITTQGEEIGRNIQVGINLPAILKRPAGKEDIFVQEGDILYIPRQLQTIKINGEVLSPNTVVYTKNKSFKQYISSAGGFSDKSLKRRSYILYANGSMKSTRKILFFNNYPSVKPGAEIFVQRKIEKQKLSATEVMGLSTGIVSLAAIILSLLK